MLWRVVVCIVGVRVGVAQPTRQERYRRCPRPQYKRFMPSSRDTISGRTLNNRTDLRSDLAGTSKSVAGPGDRARTLRGVV